MESFAGKQPGSRGSDARGGTGDENNARIIGHKKNLYKQEYLLSPSGDRGVFMSGNGMEINLNFHDYKTFCWFPLDKQTESC